MHPPRPRTAAGYWSTGYGRGAAIAKGWRWRPGLADLAPSTELRRAFKNGTLNFAEFRRRYRSELAAHPEHWWPLLEMTEGGTLTLVYAARDEHENNARVLAEWLEQEGERLNRPSSPACMAGELDRGLSGDD
ncbi:probable uroporphyrin-III c-methyltransferase [Stutzerimonas stutzeri]|jgi:uncharacterized protein YeaO (DUF488 family)|nr:putative bacteriophage protein [Stutzerimonas stutzeri DSM 4166]GBC58234.1 probable uroporphyrin-III c-methyltransferase [Stutzerimonas stutzeri]